VPEPDKGDLQLIINALLTSPVVSDTWTVRFWYRVPGRKSL